MIMMEDLQTPKSNIFVLGNGESRDGIELKQFKQWGKIYGCNALYRDFKPDGLISTDWAMMHEIYSSGYCKENKCYFRQWKILPEQFYEMLQYTGLEQSSMEQLNEQLKKLDLDTVDKFLHQNEKGNRTSLVCHGIDPERFKDTILEVLSTFKGLPKGDVRQKLGNAGLWITWVDEFDKVKDLDQFFDGEFRGWSSGPTAVRVGIEENKSFTTQVFLLGFDMTREGLVNNVYKDTDCYISSDCKYVSPTNWIEQHTDNFKSYPEIKFYRVIDDKSEIEEWSQYDNVKTISYGQMFGHLVQPGCKFSSI